MSRNFNTFVHSSNRNLNWPQGQLHEPKFQIKNFEVAGTLNSSAPVNSRFDHELELLNQSAHPDLSIDNSPIHGSLCDIRDHMSPTCKVASEEGLRKLVQVYNRTSHTDRNTVQMGKGWGAHYLLNQKPNEPCVFFSYGISHDWTFDSQLAMDWNCEGLLFDPTINHPPVMQPGNLKFARKGAPILGGNSFEVISPVKLRKELKYERVHVLKMDCEGCEYALIKDVAQEDLNFFDRIDQFSVEIHLSTKWIRSNEHINNLGLLYHVLFSAGFELIHKDITHCAPEDEATGCPDVLKSMGYPCHAHCHNYLFARPNGRHGSGSYASSDILTRMKLDRHEPFKSQIHQYFSMEPTRQLHFVTYGDDAFALSRERLVREARSMRVFSSAHAYSRSELQRDRDFVAWVDPIKSVWNSKKGGGYWIWKPYIINKTLNSISNRDILVYADAGCICNRNGLKRFGDYIRSLNETEYGVLSFQLTHKEFKWTSRQILEAFNQSATSKHGTSEMYHSTVLIFVKNHHALKVVNMWLNFIRSHPTFVTDDHNKDAQDPSFIQNRHDQSIFSLVRKIEGSVVRRDDTWTVEFLGDWNHESGDAGADALMSPFIAARMGNSDDSCAGLGRFVCRVH
jgi:hypothetical protein